MRRMLFYMFVSLAFFLIAAIQNSCGQSDRAALSVSDDMPTILIDPGQ